MGGFFFRRFLVALVLLGGIVLAAPRAALADCTNPVGQEGWLMYNSTFKVVQFCNGTDWINTTGYGGGSAGADVSFSAHKNNVNQTVVTNTSTKLTWSTEDFDTNSNFDLAAGRFTPAVAGKYIVTVSAFCTDNSGWCQAQIWKNGGILQQGGGNGVSVLAHVSAVVTMNGTTDYLEAGVYNGGGTTITGSTSQTRFTAALLGGGGSGGGGAETDPEVGALTANKWCQANAGGNAIVCSADAPGADNLGNHTATQDISAGGFSLLDAGKLALVPVAGSAGIMSGAKSLPNLADVQDALNPADGEVLTYNNTAGEWQATAPGSVTETDPQVGTLTEGKWCTVSGGVIVCTSDAPSGGGGGPADCPVPGNTCADGTKYAGSYAGWHYFTTTADSSTGTNLPAAVSICDNLVANGKSDWVLPPTWILPMLYENRLEIGGFNTSSVYWSASEDGYGNAWAIYFLNGGHYYYDVGNSAIRVRCVRRIRL